MSHAITCDKVTALLRGSGAGALIVVGDEDDSGIEPSLFLKADAIWIWLAGDAENPARGESGGGGFVQSGARRSS